VDCGPEFLLDMFLEPPPEWLLGNCPHLHILHLFGHLNEKWVMHLDLSLVVDLELVQRYFFS
jgi:hypothetical protein